jgi:60 kDa SS-A/Ro ribonucleoprotein
MRTNQNTASYYCPVFTKEGAPSTRVPPLQMLKRLTMACMLWEDSFYVDGKKHTEIIEEVCKKVKPEKIVQLAKDCHKKGLLRHVPLFLIVQALKQKAVCKGAIYDICTRPDQMTELLSLYWKDGKKPLAAQLKKGLANAFTRFDRYQLGKYRNG